MLTVPFQLLVLVSDATDPRCVTIKRDAGANGELMVTADQDTMLHRLEAFAPNIVHVFCHGSNDPLPQLEIETRTDFVAATGRGSIRLDPMAMRPLAEASSLWLIVLNCCKGAAAGSNLHSLARTLVACGAPAVVAMREAVTVLDANLFTRAFYRTLLPALECELTSRGMTTAGAMGHPIPDPLWVDALFEVRRTLSTDAKRNANSSPEWTYPVAYVNRDELRIVRATPPVHLDEETQRTLRATLDELQRIRAPFLTAQPPQKVSVATFTRAINDLRQQLGLPPEPR
jgi:CHAT domain